MPRLSKTRLTPAACRELGTGDHPDSEIRGLYLRVTRAGSRSFTLRYRTPEGRQRRITLGKLGVDLTLSQARQRARDLLAGIAHGEDPSGDRAKLRAEMTVAELGERYIASKKIKPATVNTYRDLLRIQVGPELGRKKISTVTRSDVSSFYRSASKRSEARAILAVKLLRAMFSFAMQEEILDSNPAAKVKIGTVKKRRRYLSQDERRRFWAALAHLEKTSKIHPATLTAIKLVAMTGARKSEILRLRWSEVDLEAARIVKEEHKTDQHGKVRTILVDGPALEILRKLAETRDSLTWVFPSAKDPGRPIPAVDDAFTRILEIAGIENLRPHDLRHSFASDAIRRGVPLAVIGEMLGHSAPHVTARYAHLDETTTRAALRETLAEMNGKNSNVVMMTPKTKTKKTS